jgi:hypothetical protein
MVHDVLGREVATNGNILVHEHIQFGLPGAELDPGVRSSDGRRWYAQAPSSSTDGYRKDAISSGGSPPNSP